MEWKRVKTVLIAVLALTCLILGFNIAQQMRAQTARAERAVRDACAVAAADGIAVEPALVLALPADGELLRAARDTAREQALAEGLLGGAVTLSEPGGGVSLFSGAAGRLSIRRGGALELTLHGWDGAFDAEGLAALLGGAGLELTPGDGAEENGAYVFTQSVDGVPAVNCRLTCARAGDTLTVSGRWLLETPAGTGTLSATRAELVLALCAAAKELDGCTAVTGLTRGFSLGSGGVRELNLTPVWVAETDAGLVWLDTVTKKALSVA